MHLNPIIKVIGKREINILSCKIEGEVYFENSQGHIIECEIHNSGSSGIRCNSSELEIQNCKVYKNYYHGLKSEENSKVKIINSKIYENGNNEGS
ncbi:right-handed parallel beta-helix repeat-containing protein [Calditerrivibrio nitroreducens]|uniref:right-handed parallel beta-helix repeat-containing protein n=1 Tax=Calditerrivibrio nitroreducens TaxID=477976 RepID=UPI000303456A|nr:right-handed parallel beta-helix repeat-containing protein [Calditerrivibrio nitroreducens]